MNDVIIQTAMLKGEIDLYTVALAYTVSWVGI